HYHSFPICHRLVSGRHAPSIERSRAERHHSGWRPGVGSNSTSQRAAAMNLVALLRNALLVAIVTAGLSSCAMNPVTGRPDLVLQSEAGEIKRAREVH